MTPDSALEQPLVWAEVDLSAITHNIAELSRVSRPARLMAVVKANAYGHGAVRIARQSLAAGAQSLGVARIDEAIRLREAGLEAPILIFGYTPPALADILLDQELTTMVASLESAQALSEAAVSRGAKVRVHLKVDTGMGRLGLVAGDARPEDAMAAALEIVRLPGLVPEGIFTHFATADSADKTYAREQFERFLALLDRLRGEGVEFPVRHAANSAAIIDLPETHLDLVRAGIALYGLAPSAEVDLQRVDLRPALTLKARIVHLKQVPAGFKVSYGTTYTAPQPTVIATVPLGYADGYSRRLSSRGSMLVGSQRAPIAGRVCMDMTMLDVGGIRGVAVGDEVVAFGRQGTASLTADEIAETTGTLNYEVVARLTARVPRRYKSSL